jgi:segregation and condensation protein B
MNPVDPHSRENSCIISILCCQEGVIFLAISLQAVLEAGLFASSEPLSLAQLQKMCAASEQEILEAITGLRRDLESQTRGLILLERPEGYQLGTKPEAASKIEKLFDENCISLPLSQAALEALVIIALKQPVTRLEVEHIRGVKTDGVIENLVKRGFVEIAGRREGLGRPFLYRTTEEFFNYFGVQDLAELETFFNEEMGHLLEGTEKDSEQRR